MQIANRLMNVETSIIQTIIIVFEIIVKFNIIIKNQLYINFINFHQYAIHAKKIYQVLIKCASKTRNASKTNENLFDNENDTDLSNFERNLSEASQTQRKKNNKFKKLLNFSNVHVDFHLTNNAREYETIMNCNVLIEKFKHKY